MVKKNTNEIIEPGEVDIEQQTTSVNKDTSVVSSSIELPKEAVAYFNRHHDVKAAYIDKQGGVFTENTPEIFIKDAVLYQNPYFNK